ncbi:MAG: ABC transporter ATP-binding protein [Desulfobacterales bacterium]|nr:MAG: ABC transporter ATP-binding protein [Desulfobacterales bacterium]
MKDQPLIKMIGITKTFPGVVANDNVDFDLHAGEIHSILGENGAGKTTLMKILSGVYQPDTGSIRVNDQAVRIRSPQDSVRLGIGMVYQHFSLVANLTVIENLILGCEDGLFLNVEKALRKLQEMSERYGLFIDPDRETRDLSINERQRTEILKILFRESDVLILDEPTSMLSPAETESLFQTLMLLRNAGKAVVLITHNLSEALAVSDRITIMRSGQKTAQMSKETLRDLDADTSSKKILELMFGTVPLSDAGTVAKVSDDQPVLELKQVEARDSRGRISLKRISFSVVKGEIFGIAGVDGESRRLLAEIIGGQKRLTSGKLIYRGQDITRADIAERFELGISYITDDRMNEGCIPDMDLAENAILQSYARRPFSHWGVLKWLNVHSFTEDLIKHFGIRTTGPDARLRTLSGGNIQKFILARGLSGSPGLIVCNSPTYGLDAKTVGFIRKLLIKESRKGTAVLLLTSDIDELLFCSSRIGVLFNGEIAGSMDRGDASPENVAKLMLGIRE